MKCNGITVVSDGMKSLKGVYKESKELIKEYNIFKTIKSDLKEFVTGVDESVYRGNVNTDGITDDKARQIIDTSKSGLKAYAKANNLNIVIHTPQKYESGANSFEKPLSVSVTSNELVNSYTDNKVINGDTTKTSLYLTDKLTAEDTFLRRVYRTVEELKNNIENKKKN